MSASMDIRPAIAADMPALLDLFRVAYATAPHIDDDETEFIAELKGSFDPGQTYRIHFFVLEDGGQIVAFGGIAESGFMDGSWELRWGTTHPAHQGRGLMTRLAEHRIAYAKAETQDLPAIIHIGARQPGLYIRLGFQTIFTQNRGTRGDIYYMTKIIGA